MTVDRNVHDEFVDRFVDAASALVTGDPHESATQIGPVINDKQLGTIQDTIARSVDAGAELALTGDPGGPTGRVLPPQVLLGTNQVASAAEEVAFGGEKQSGLGRFGGEWVLEDFTSQHWVSIQHIRRPLPF